MKSKKSRRRRSGRHRIARRKTGEQGAPNLPSQVLQEKGRQLAATMTGEIFQPIRVHYDVLDTGQLQARFSKLRCIEYVAHQNRRVWLYTREARKLKFKRKPKTDAPVILGEFLLKENDKMVLNLRSFERATKAIVFFDRHIRRSIIQVTSVTAVNRLFRSEEVVSLPSLDRFFEEAETVERDPEAYIGPQKLDH